MNLTFSSFIIYPIRLVDCEFEEWNQFTTCTETCGGGTQFRTRGTKVSASCGGKECKGKTKEERSCNNNECPSTS